ncbi:unnamed protein product [Psylliodes chrysocephalus]|uniref:Uncharacterized protein n=1 Tax=Psylliodes chrysocephalus TaxID=3402493 RepID=A0A9P0CM48_9CUCU|nr:unnamed protein product [Psylliodes chrysocephala]
MNSSDEEDSDNFSLHSSSIEGSISDFLLEMEEHREEEQPFTIEKQVGDWAIVKFCSKETFHGKTIFSFVRKTSEREGKTIFCYPLQEDVSVSINANIVSNLPQPFIGRRGEMIFSVGFASYNIQ